MSGRVRDDASVIGKLEKKFQKERDKVNCLKKDIMEAKRLHFKKVARFERIIQNKDDLIAIQNAMIQTQESRIAELERELANRN